MRKSRLRVVLPSIALAWVLAHKWTTVGVTVLTLALSLVAAKNLGSEFISVEDHAQMIADLKLPDSASLELSAQRANEAEALLRKIPEVSDVYSIVGVNGEVNKVKMRALLTPKQSRKKNILQLKDEARAALAGALPATQVAISDPPTIEGLGDFFPIMMRVVGPDLRELNKHAQFIADALKARGVEVLHIMGKESLIVHPYTSAASVVDGELYYGPSRDLFG